MHGDYEIQSGGAKSSAQLNLKEYHLESSPSIIQQVYAEHNRVIWTEL